MNLLAKTDEMFSRSLKKATEAWNVALQGGLNPEEVYTMTFKEFCEFYWNQELLHIRKIAPKYHQLKDLLKELKIMNNDTADNTPHLPNKWVFITLRPEPNSTTLNKFVNDIHKLAKKPAWLSGYYCFEQTGKNNEDIGQGFHAHLLLECKCYIKGVKDILEKLQFIKYNCIKQIGEQEGNKFIRLQKDLNYCLNYINGEKFNDEKLKAVEFDIIWRKKYNLDKLYKLAVESRPEKPTANNNIP